MRWTLVLAMLFTLALSAAIVFAINLPDPKPVVRQENYIGRYYDADADVICWFYYNGSHSLSCLPRSETKFTIEQLTEKVQP